MSYLMAAYAVTLGCLLGYALHLQRERRRERRALGSSASDEPASRATAPS